MSSNKILESGFVVADSEDIVVAPSNTDLFTGLILGKKHLHKDNKLYHSAETERLVSIYNNNPDCIRNLEFRKKLLTLAKGLFGPNFYRWALLQTTEGALSELHTSFLADTFRYIGTKERKIHISQWTSLISLDAETLRTRFEVADFFSEQGTVGLERIPSDINETLFRWVADPRGFTDLLLTCQVIFGTTPAVRHVSHTD